MTQYTDSKPKEVWLIIGKVTNPEAHNCEAIEGQTEYQFSDGPDGGRSSSADYVDIIKGLKDHSGFIIHFAPPATQPIINTTPFHP
jgi:hypothetical protein